MLLESPITPVSGEKAKLWIQAYLKTRLMEMDNICYSVPTQASQRQHPAIFTR